MATLPVASEPDPAPGPPTLAEPLAGRLLQPVDGPTAPADAPQPDPTPVPAPKTEVSSPVESPAPPAASLDVPVPAGRPPRPTRSGVRIRWRALLQRAMVRTWQHRGPVAVLLWPLSLVHAFVRGLRAVAFRTGLRRAVRVGVPVVVVGNLYVGGTGKTPLTLALIHALRLRGFRPGAVSRGYGRGASRGPRMVDSQAVASEVGDEPLLIAHASGVPVAVGRDRVGAARLLLSLHPDIDVIVTDDGLQHLRLARDMEIAVVHGRGLGNGWLLPAGPLRDPPGRLQDVDAVVFHGGLAPVRIHSPFFRLDSEVVEAYALAEPGQRMTLAALAHEQRTRRLAILAACGIGMPDRFFGMLRDAGLDIDELPFHDHYDFADLPFAAVPHNRILITEKDAVKCRDMPPLRADLRIWVVPLRVTLDVGLIDLVTHRIGPPRHGSAPA